MSEQRDQTPEFEVRVRQSLEDLVDHGEAAARLVSRGKAAYDSDEMLRYAAESLIVRAGEAVHRIDRASPMFVDDHPHLELRKVKDARNVVAHGYDIIDAGIVWSILEAHLPSVVVRVRELLREQ